MSSTVQQATTALAAPSRSIVLTAVVLLKLAITASLFALGFAGISADEYTRSIDAARWASAPWFVVGEAWPPFQLYLNGLLIGLVGDPLWVPRLTAFIFSCVLCVYYFKLVDGIFNSFSVALLAVLGLVIFKWHMAISATPALEVYYTACLVAGLFYVLLWFKNRQDSRLVLAGILMMLATGFSYHSWLVLLVLDVVALGALLYFVDRRDFAALGSIVVFGVISHAYVFFNLLSTYLRTGNAFSHLAAHNDYSSWYYDYGNVEWYKKLLHYPLTLATEVNQIILLLALGGVVLVASEKRVRKGLLLPGLLGISLLLAFSAFNLFSVPPTAAPGRLSQLFYIFFIPYAAYFVLHWPLLARRIALHNGLKGRAAALLSHLTLPATITVCVVIAVRGFVEVSKMNRNFNDALAAGYVIAETVGSSPHAARYLVELSFWDYLGVELTSRHYGGMRLDRPLDLRNTTYSSMFEGKPEALLRWIETEKVAAVAFRDPALVEMARQNLKIVHRGERWTVFSTTR